uniref:ZP domain-containing protein n=2 Tax=Esox lucius TaxID=8010 RepID=A0AAY5KC04_ESOLU
MGNASVVCNETSMTVVLKKASMVGLSEDHLRLSDPSCSLSSNSSHIFRTMALNACGTQLEEDGDNLIFRNEISSFDSAVITRRQQVEIEFSCIYPKKSNVSLEFLVHKIPYIFREKGFGKFTYQFEFFQSSLFNIMVDPATYPLEVDLQEIVYMEIVSTSSVPNTKMFVESCKATPSDNPNDSTYYSIIQNGCTKDETVQIYPRSQSQFRFAIEAFKFIGMHDQVYISCAVILCEAGNPNTRCDQGCINENSMTTPPHNRLVREAVLETATHYISQGPLRMRRSTDSKAVMALNLNLVFIASCLLAAVAMVSGVVLYRSSKSKIKYQPLPTSE